MQPSTLWAAWPQLAKPIENMLAGADYNWSENLRAILEVSVLGAYHSWYRFRDQSNKLQMGKTSLLLRIREAESARHCD